jgi:hypothetical protein
MQFEELNWDISQYNVDELMGLFEVKPGQYSEADIDAKIQQFRELVAEMDGITARKVIRFMKKAKRRLIPLPPGEIQSVHPEPTIYQDHVRKEKYPYVFSNPSEFFPGTLNPIEKRLMTRLLSIDTLFRENTKTKITISTDFMYKLPQRLTNVASMQLVSFEMPRNWYNVSSKYNNNTVVISLYNMSRYPNAVYTIQIPDGNYNFIQFEDMLNEYFLKHGQGLEFLVAEVSPITSCTVIRVRSDKTISSGGGDDCTSTTNISPYDSTNLYYSPNFHFMVDFKSLTGAPLYKTLGWMMGFRQSSYAVSYINQYTDLVTKTIFYGYLQSESSYGSTVDNYIFVEIDDFNNNFTSDTIMSSTGPTSFIGNNILGRISLRSGAFTVVDNNAADKIFKKREYFGAVTIDKLRIRLLNRFGQVIDLVNNDYSFALQFEQLYV